jgi:TRAP-type mannitol/chloroaromatic compound transport system substrate-binding protein
MKNKVFLILLAVTLVIGLIAIGCTKPADTPSSTQPAAAAAAPAQAAPPTGQVYKWQMPTIWAKGNAPTFPMIAELCASIKKASSGRLDITPYGADEIVPATEQWDAVKTGTFKIHISPGGYLTGKTKAAYFSEFLPYTIETEREAYYWLYQLGGLDYLRKTYAKYNLYPVGITVGVDFTMISKFPVTKVADMSGKKFRAMGITAEILSSAGAGTVFFPLGEVYQSLQSGAVDGAVIGPVSSVFKQGLYQVAKYVDYPSIAPCQGTEITMNLDTWKALPDDLKEILTSSVEAFYVHWNSGMQAARLEGISGILKAGKEVSTMPPEEVAKLGKIAAPIYDKYAAGDPEFAEGWTLVKKLLATK